MKSISLIVMIFIISGCSCKEPMPEIVCNTMPLPSKNSIIKIKDINDNEVDKWIKDLLILKKQLEIDCNKNKGNK